MKSIFRVCHFDVPFFVSRSFDYYISKLLNFDDNELLYLSCLIDSTYFESTD